MMAAVFFMQPVGQLASQLVGLFVTIGYGNMYPVLKTCTNPVDCASYIDGIWRWVTGVGAIPAVVAIYYRFRIKDPGLYDLDVKNQGNRAVKNTEKIYGGAGTAPYSTMEMQQAPNMNGDNHTDPPLPDQFSRVDIYKYFWEQGNWRYVLGTSFCWFLLDW
jgi:PHS family inorganic phosphate transporter-like MFS transporter